MSRTEAWLDLFTLMVSWWMCWAGGAWLIGSACGRSKLSRPMIGLVIGVQAAAAGLVGKLLSAWWLGRYLQ